MITSRLSRKGRTTIPRSVRAALRLREGDTLTYEIVDDQVILKNAGITPADGPFKSFEEWSLEADRCAYADL